MKIPKQLIFILVIICLIGAENLTALNKTEVYNLRDPFNAGNYGETLVIDDQEELFIFNVVYRDVDTMVRIVKELYPKLIVTGEPESKQIIIKAQRSYFNNLAGRLRQLDSALDQILIEVKVVEVSQSELDQIGISWDLEQNGITLAQRQKTEEFIQKINLLVGKGSAKIMANPRVTTLLGSEALIHIGDQIPYAVPIESASGKISWSVKYLDAGINLNILPLKAERNYISLKLIPEVATIKQWKMTPNGEFPIISSRKVETFLRLKNKESFILGGLLDEQERENISKVPFLGDIPIINNFFTTKSVEKVRSDVLFLVKAEKI